MIRQEMSVKCLKLGSSGGIRQEAEGLDFCMHVPGTGEEVAGLTGQRRRAARQCGGRDTIGPHLVLLDLLEAQSHGVCQFLLGPPQSLTTHPDLQSDIGIDWLNGLVGASGHPASFRIRHQFGTTAWGHAGMHRRIPVQTRRQTHPRPLPRACIIHSGDGKAPRHLRVSPDAPRLISRRIRRRIRHWRGRSRAAARYPASSPRPGAA